jgi:hypothetical protein
VVVPVHELPLARLPHLLHVVGQGDRRSRFTPRSESRCPLYSRPTLRPLVPPSLIPTLLPLYSPLTIKIPKHVWYTYTVWDIMTAGLQAEENKPRKPANTRLMGFSRQPN